ncbi:hypothetical protein D9M71_494880 [compost metagenome]
MQLADPRFADAQHLADLLQIQLFVVIQRQHQPFTLRQLADGLGQGGLKTLVLQPAGWLVVQQRGVFPQSAALLAVLQKVVEAVQPAALGVGENRVVIVETHL